MTPEFQQLTQKEHAMMGQRHLARHGYLAATDEPHLGNSLVGGATWARGHTAGAPATTSFPPLPSRGRSGTPPQWASPCSRSCQRMGLDPFSRCLSPLEFQRLAIRGGRKGANGVLQAQGWECHLPDLGLANPQPPGLPQVPHRLDLEAQQLRPDHVSR
jgi:hypothetical protein